MGNQDVNLSLFASGVVIFIRDIKESIIKPLELMNTFSKYQLTNFTYKSQNQ